MKKRLNAPKSKSHENAKDSVLAAISAEEMKTFLVECANLPNPIGYPDHKPHFERWLRRWRSLFTFRGEDVESGESEWRTFAVPRAHLELFAPIVRTTLNRLWLEKDARQRDWYCYRLRDAHRQMIRHLEGWDESPLWGGPRTVQRLTDYALQDAPRVCPFESAVDWLQRNETLTLICARPSCEAPYIFRAELKRRQKFCSPECADPARREAKLKWWNESPNSPKNRAGRTPATEAVE